MEEHICEARLPHINRNVVRKGRIGFKCDVRDGVGQLLSVRFREIIPPRKEEELQIPKQGRGGYQVNIFHTT